MGPVSWDTGQKPHPFKTTASHSHTPETQIEPSCFKFNDTAFRWDIIDDSHNILKIF